MLTLLGGPAVLNRRRVEVTMMHMKTTLLVLASTTNTEIEPESID
jgi:hypothetical protein